MLSNIQSPDRGMRFVDQGDAASPIRTTRAPTAMSAAQATASSTSRANLSPLVGKAIDSLLRESYSAGALPMHVRAAVVASTLAKFKAYERHFDRFNVDQGGYTLRGIFGRLSPHSVKHMLLNQQTISRLSADETHRACVERDVRNIATVAAYSAHNRAMTGYDGSVFLSNDPLAAKLRQPGGLVSRLNTHLCRVGPDDHRRLTTLSIAAPAFDSVDQPEYRDYVDQSGRLKPDMMARRFDEIREHVMSHAALNPWIKRVVLSGAGSGAFLARLSPEDQRIARTIQADAWARLAVDLRAIGRDVAYSDKATTSSLWQQVNDQLPPQRPLVNLMRAPGPWISEGDILLNSHDNAAFEGNECKPESQEGALGAASTMHVVDVLRAAVSSSLAEHGIQRSPFHGRNVMSPDSHEVVGRIDLAKENNAPATMPPSALITMF